MSGPDPTQITDEEEAPEEGVTRAPTLYSAGRARTPHPGAMLDRWGLLGKLLSRLFFSAVSFPAEAVERVREASRRGTVVYVLRTRSTLEYLYFNYAFLAHHLPLARFANGLRLFLWQRVTVLLGALLGRRPHRPPVEALVRLTRARRSSLLFLRDRTPYLVPREFQGPYLEALVALQRTQERPVMLVPLTVIWGRRPIRGGPGRARLFHPLLGDVEEPRLLRRIWQIVRHAHRSLAIVCEPLDLRQFLAGHEAGAVDALDRELDARIEGERTVRLGPRRAHPVTLRRRVLAEPAVRAAMRERAERLSEPLWRVWLHAWFEVRRMQANMTPRGLTRLSWMVRQVWRRIFSGFEVDEGGIARAKRAGTGGPLVYLPTHRSHVDYLVLSDLCIARDVAPPLIAAGINLSFWPMGWLFRTAGAFFLRRGGSRVDALYTALLRAYVAAIMREGHSIEIFLEGTRSRTGRMLPPKVGLLSVIADLVASGEVPAASVVPIWIGYDRVLELASLTRELSGSQKKPESVLGILKASRVLGSRYGFVHVRFAPPVDARAFLASQGFGSAEAGEEVRRRAIHALGVHCLEEAGASAGITRSALAAAALLSSGTAAVGRAALEAAIAVRAAAARAAGARLEEGDLDEALELLARDRAIERVDGGREPRYGCEGGARVRLEYYKNGALGHWLDAASLALALRSLWRLDRRPERDRVLAAWAAVVSVARAHVVYRPAGGDEALRRLAAVGAIAEQGGRVLPGPAGDAALGLLCALVESHFQAQAATAAALPHLLHRPRRRRELEADLTEALHRRRSAGALRPEACQAPYVASAVDWLAGRGAVRLEGSGGEAMVVPVRAADAEARWLEGLLGR